jgi:serine/threonine protein kinase
MKFWDMDLEDGRCFLNYGIPGGSCIETTLNDAQTLFVVGHSERSAEYHFSGRDTIASLLEHVAFEGRTRRLVVMVGESEQPKETLLKDLRTREVHLAPAVRLSQFPRVQDVGQGPFGNVYKTKNEQAVKIIRREEAEVDAKDEEALDREIERISSIHHETLLCLRGYVPANAPKDPPAILTDYMSRGSLRRLLEGETPPGWDGVQKLIVLYGVSVGMLILERNRIIHGDLKPSNVLLNEALEPKVADFALSKFVDVSRIAFGVQDVVTLSYMAPEVLDGKSLDRDADVYAYGILVYATITKRVPYEGVTCDSLRAEVTGGKRPDLPGDVNPKWRDLIERCWNRDPLMRPGWKWICEELGSGKFVRGFRPDDASRFAE